MGSIDKRVNGTWRVRWREYPGGPQRCQHFDRKADASRFLAGVEGDLVSGRYLDPAGGQVRFEVYAEQWRQAQIHRPTTAVQTESYLRNHAYPFLGSRPLGEIRRSEIQAWVKGRSDVLAPGSVELAYRWVATIFKAAIADRLIAVSPCEKITLPRRDRPELVPMEVEMVERLADAVPERYRALIVMAAGTGLRQGECFGLTIDRVDFLRKQLRVDRQLISAQGRTPVFGPPKSKAGYRTVPLPGVVVDALAFHLQRHPGKPDTLVFTNYTGQPIRRSAFGDIWHRACRKADIPKGFTFHDLRHFYASLLIAKGSSVKTVQRRLGHQSAVETLDTYSHLWPDNEDETRDAVDAVFEFGSATAKTPS